MPLSLSCSKTIYYIAVFGLLVYPELYILEERVILCVQTNHYLGIQIDQKKHLKGPGTLAI